MKINIERFLVCFIVFGLAQGCSSMSFVSMYKLSRLDPLTADPQLIRIAVRTNNAVGLNKGDVRMQLGYVAQDNSLIIDDLYLVEVTNEIVLNKELQAGLEEGEAITIMHLSEADAKQMRNTQKLIAQRKASKLEGKGNFGLSINSSCLKTALPKDMLLVDILMQTDPDDAFFSIIEDLDLFQQEGIESLRNWPVCSEARPN